jgi:tetratricopeptide (TPR) repeat protein
MFTEALEAVRDGNYEDALQKFMDSYEQEPHPDTLFNIARTYNDLGMKDKAGEFFQKAARMTANQIINKSRV